jgi:PAS domain S-box-containing protein
MMAVDVTERVRVQQQLAEASSKLEQLAFIINQSTTVAVRWLVQPDWPVAFISDNIARYGYSPEEFYSGQLIFDDIVHPEDVERINAEAWQMVERGITDFAQEYRIVTRGGEARWMENRIWVWWGPEGDVRYADGILVDVTERKQAEAELRSTRQFLENLLEHAPMPIFVDSTDNHVRLVNRAWAALFGKSRENSVGQQLDALFGESAQAMIASNQRVVQEGKPIFTEEVLMGQDGKTHAFETVKFGLFEDDGSVEAVGGIMLDITFRKQAEAELQEAARVLERRVQERTAQLQATNHELEAFSYSVSHDLRAPLRSMDGFALAVIEDYGERLDATAREHLQRVRKAAQRMGEMLDALLNFTRIGRQDMDRQTVDLSALARSIVAELRAAEPGRQVAVDIEDGLRASGDQRLLYMLLHNLLDNAWKFTRHRPQAQIRFYAETHNGRREFVVEDNGAGFDMAHAGKLFEPFRRLHTESEFPGTGLGLCIVRRIIERHGGRIRAQGRPGRGARFEFSLP